MGITTTSPLVTPRSTATNSDALDFIDEYDKRPLINDLLAERSLDINSVRKAIQLHPLYDPRYDDIWILRYVLSHKKDTNAASRAAIATMEFRETHQLNDQNLRAKVIHLDGDRDADRMPSIQKLNACAEKYAALATLPDQRRGVIMYVFLDKLDMGRLDETMTQEELKLCLVYTNESIYQVLDDITRKTGRLTKLCKVVDMEGMTMGKMNRSYLSKESAASKEVDDYFPQLLGGILVANPPKWIGVIWKLCRLLMPARIFEKVDFLPSNSEKVQKRLLKFVSKRNLLERYGGDNKEWPPPSAGSCFK